MASRRSIETPKTSYDAVIIGSGAGGSAVALRLAQRGAKVLVVEQGDWFKPKSDAIEPNDYLYDTHSPTDDLPYVGGRTKFYGAALYRYRESDFRETIHEAGVSPAWPISYADLEPYYEQAETLYKVHGSPNGDPSEPHRAHPYPHPPLPHDPVVAKVVAKLEARGTPVAPIPRGLDYGPGRPCTLGANCDVHFCRRDAKMDAEIAALRPALATGNVDLMTLTTCERVLVTADGQRAEGVALKRNGVEYRVTAPVVVVAAGAPASALLMRRSRTDKHREGLGNNAGQLGRHVGAHSTGTLFPMISLSRLGPRHTKTFGLNLWYDGTDDWPYPLGVAQVAGQVPFWRLASKLKQPIVREVAEHSLAVFHMTEATPDEGTGWAFDGDKLGAFTQARHQPNSYQKLRELTAKAFERAGYPVLKASRPVDFWHHTGSAVMGLNPSSSVVDATGQVHGVSGLYMADASVLPSAGAVNTGLTIIALALRTGDAIAGKLAARQEAAAPLS